MKILHISDTHSCHRELPPLPEADILVHSGDFTRYGSKSEAYDFMEWLCDLPFRHIVFIAGNHDLCMRGAGCFGEIPDNVHYLCNTGAEIEGLKFWGLPMFAHDKKDGSYDNNIAAIPYGTDILVSHEPPYGMCDLADYGHGLKHHGSERLMEQVNLVHPHLHLFGHEHDAYGAELQNGIFFSNASFMDSKYNLVNEGRRIILSEEGRVKDRFEGRVKSEESF